MLRRLPVLLCALVAVVSASVVVAPVAAAQEDEVFVDPGSPSGKEYELPINRARQQAGPSTKKRSGAQKAPLFGEGVERKDSGPARRESTRPKRGDRTKDSERAVSRERRRSRDGALDAREVELARTRALQARAAAGPEGGIGVGGIIGVGVGVLLVGGLAGLWLRRRATS